MVYGKSELQPVKISWLRELTYIRTSFCKNLHAKRSVNEELRVVAGLNLYEFRQVNNNEMGILIRREQNPELCGEDEEKAQRIVCISDGIRIRSSASLRHRSPA